MLTDTRSGDTENSGKVPRRLLGGWRALCHSPLLSTPPIFLSQPEHQLRETALSFCLLPSLQYLEHLVAHLIFAEWVIQILQKSSSRTMALSWLYLLWWTLPALCVVYILVGRTFMSKLYSVLYLSILFMLVFYCKPRGQKAIVPE